jgi:RimJ/RimL family protein N-acetyltransferase
MRTFDEQNVSDLPMLNLVGQKVALGPIRKDLIDLHYQWANDFEVWRTVVSWTRPRPRDTQESWYERASRDEQTIVFEIYERATLRPIGNTELHSIDHFNGTAEFTIFIGARDCWGKGYGTEATTLTLDYAFNVLGLANVLLIVYDFNERAIRAYTRAGFKVIGRRRNALRQGSRRHDIIYMESLAEEFASSPSSR